MVLRALLPAGWMPNPAGFAQSPLVICLHDMPSGMDMSHAMDMSKSKDMGMPGHGQDNGQQQNNETCPFAAAPHVAPPALAVAFSTPELAQGTLLFHTLTEPAANKAPYTPQSPRAPPSFA